MAIYHMYFYPYPVGTVQILDITLPVPFPEGSEIKINISLFTIFLNGNRDKKSGQITGKLVIRPGLLSFC